MAACGIGRPLGCRPGCLAARHLLGALARGGQDAEGGRGRAPRREPAAVPRRVHRGKRPRVPARGRLPPALLLLLRPRLSAPLLRSLPDFFPPRSVARAAWARCPNRRGGPSVVLWPRLRGRAVQVWYCEALWACLEVVYCARILAVPRREQCSARASPSGAPRSLTVPHLGTPGAKGLKSQRPPWL